jgi:NAD(P)-dependent dehydrogenase (short-subunit alcohol dehydrogenase family)
MELGLKDKVAVITGASKGIGKAIALALGREGCLIAMAARGMEDLNRTADEVRQANCDVLAVAADMTVPDDISKFMKETISRFGTVHILINNVGGVGSFSPFGKLSDDDWYHILTLNLMSAVRMTRLVLPYMQKQRFGRIINIASESGIQPDPIMPHYNASKAALINFSKSLSKAYGKDNILVNAVSPAMTRTDLVEKFFREESEKRGLSLEDTVAEVVMEFRPHIVVERPAAPQEVADVVAFLASEKSSFITGANIRVDGGSVACIS